MQIYLMLICISKRKFDCYLHVIFQDSHGLFRIDALPNFKALLTGTREGKMNERREDSFKFLLFLFCLYHLACYVNEMYMNVCRREKEK